MRALCVLANCLHSLQYDSLPKQILGRNWGKSVICLTIISVFRVRRNGCLHCYRWMQTAFNSTHLLALNVGHMITLAREKRTRNANDSIAASNQSAETIDSNKSDEWRMRRNQYANALIENLMKFTSCKNTTQWCSPFFGSALRNLREEITF